MTDVFSSSKRSEVMSKIKCKSTQIEIIVRHCLYTEGYRYRLNDKRYPGTPDIVIPKLKTAIFIHGCFWHAHDNCKYFRIPKTRTDFWYKKLSGNMERDKVKTNQLKMLGWNVIVIWECELKINAKERLDSLLDELRQLK